MSKNSTRRDTAISFKGAQDLTRQSFKDECDVNNIVATFTQTGLVNHIARQPPQYGEAPEADFLEAASIQADIRSQQEAGTLDLDEVLNPPSPTPEEAENVPPEAPEEPSEAPESTTEDGA